MPGQLDNDTKESRSRKACAVAERMSLSYRQQMVGGIYPVLFEEREGDFFIGHTPNYVKVYLKSDQPLHNQVLQVNILRLHKDGAEGILP
jgi:threonylcarbamoyladenosine tRNA methylthiotransferase MtaB